MHALNSQPTVGYILGVQQLTSPRGLFWVGDASLEPEIADVALYAYRKDARVFGASENVGGLIFFLAARGYRVIVERVGELA